ncbi:MAG: nitroreductase family protein [Acidimicrobiales bacterium]
MTDRASASPLLDPVFTNRWSPRAFSDKPVSDEHLAAVFEAARWTPSWMNNQPWLLVYETDGPDRDAILNAFMEFNRGWASKAPVVGLTLARTELEGFMARTRDFDTGAAMMAMTLQATMLGLSMHLLGGIEVEAAHELTGTDPEDTIVLCGFVIGHQGDKSQLEEKYQEREQPSDRKPVAEFAFKGGRIA